MRVWVFPSWSKGVNWLWRDPWPIWDELPAPSSNVEYLIADYEFIPHRAEPFACQDPFLPSNWLRSWRWCYSSFSKIAERLSESLVIWSAAGNHPLTFLEAFWGCFVVFKWDFFFFLAYCCLCSPGLLVFWMRAFLVLSTGPRQPGCSAQPSPASTTATSAKTLAQSLRMCLISPSYRSLIWAKKASSFLS